MTKTPVLIVGAGPVGQLSALVLAKNNVPTHLIDRRDTPLLAPKAHAVNPRTLEICDSLGISADAIRRKGADANDAGHVRFVGTLTGPEFGSLPYERQDEGATAFTPFPLTNISQPDFEAVLTQAVEDNDKIRFERGVQCTGIEDLGDRVQATLQPLQGDASVQTYAYVIAADGASSSLRAQAGIDMDGPEALQHYMMIHFEADLTSETDDRPALLYFLMDPAISGVLIAYDREKTWVLMHPYDPATQTRDEFSDARCRDLISQAVGQECPTVRIRHKSPWAMSAQIAQRYRTGRLFLAGDAAHRFPPTGGLGLNTGAADAQNLAWKMAAVLNGDADPALLDTYEAERRPVAQVNSDQSLTNAAKIFDLILALHGVDPEATADHYADICSAPDRVARLADAVEAQRPHFDSFNLQLGYRYTSNAIVDPPEAGDPTDLDISDYRPSWVAGAHVPHLWVTQDGKTKSLLNLLPADRFSVLAGPGADIEGDPALSDLHLLTVGKDFDPNEFDWCAQTGLPSDGLLLIRPDRHIGARLARRAEAACHAITASIAQITQKN